VNLAIRLVRTALAVAWSLLLLAIAVIGAPIWVAMVAHEYHHHTRKDARGLPHDSKAQG